MKTLRYVVWGAIIGAGIATIGGHVVTWAKQKGPFNQYKVASHAAMDFTRTYGAPSEPLPERQWAPHGRDLAALRQDRHRKSKQHTTIGCGNSVTVDVPQRLIVFL